MYFLILKLFSSLTKGKQMVKTILYFYFNILVMSMVINSLNIRTTLRRVKIYSDCYTYYLSLIVIRVISYNYLVKVNYNLFLTYFSNFFTIITFNVIFLTAKGITSGVYYTESNYSTYAHNSVVTILHLIRNIRVSAVPYNSTPIQFISKVYCLVMYMLYQYNNIIIVQKCLLTLYLKSLTILF